MGSVAICVDAGYLFKQGSGAVFGTKLGRHELVFDAEKFMSDFTKWVFDQYPNDELLRTYWYDGARQGVPTPDQLDVAGLRFVKVRLGRINSAGQQKGVDTLIVRDLMVLSQERSIQRAVVLSGDEDLREGIEYAQDRGVRVAVVGIEAGGDRSQSVELVREADESLLLPRAHLVASIQRRPPLPAPVQSQPDAAAAAAEVADQAIVVGAAEAFAGEWLARASAEELAAIVAGRPKIPRPLDALMLQRALRASKAPTIGDEPRRHMRIAFWRVVDARTRT